MLSEEGKKVKAELEALEDKIKRYKSLEKRLIFWNDLGGSLKSASTEQRVSGGQTIPYAEKRLLKIEEISEELDELFNKIIQEEDKFKQDIVMLDPISQGVLMDRYLLGKPYKEIVKNAHYSERNVYYLFEKSFNKIGKDKTLQ